MVHQHWMRSILSFTTLLCLLTLPAWPQDVSQGGKWGLGLTSKYDLPLYNFYDRFDGGPKLGLKFSYVKNTTTYEITYFTSQFSKGKIEKSKFQWVYDGNYYSSPNASSEIAFTGLIASLRRPFHFKFGPLVPFWSVGAGFVYYKHEIQDLIFPGQSIPPLDESFTYSPDAEEQTSFGVNFGGGFGYNVSSQLKLSLNFQYNILFGYLRPMEAWLLEKVSPLQLLDLGIDLTYYFGE